MNILKIVKDKMVTDFNGALKIDGEIRELASKYLTNKELKKANKISKSLTKGGGEQFMAREQLSNMFPRIKRPLTYARFEITRLPETTRNSMRYLGDYLDQIIKRFTSDILNDKKYLKKSLGINLKKLKGKVDEDLRLDMDKFNDIIYVPAKHDFELPNERKHRFTVKEVVYSVFLIFAIVRRIPAISGKTELYMRGLDSNFYIEK